MIKLEDDVDHPFPINDTSVVKYIIYPFYKLFKY